MGHSGVPALLLAAAQGKLLTVVTGAADLGMYKGKVYGLHGLMVPLGSTIRDDKPENTLSDLVGKTVAVVTKSSPDFVFFSIRLRNAGIDPGKVDIVELPWPSMPAALTAKKVDAAVVVDPFRSQVLAQNMGKDLGDAVIGDQKWGSVVGDQLLPQAINFSTVDFINKEPASVQAFMRAVGKAYDFMNDPANKQVLTEVTAKWSGLPAPIVAGMKELPWVRRDKGFMNDYSGLEYLMNLWVKYGFLDKPVDIKKLVALPW
jgi:NitT/TauT family transport system substrate-binding protein